MCKVEEYEREQKKDEKLSAFVYRVHDSPNEEKLLNFSKFAKKFGYKLKTTGQLAIAKSMNELLDEIKGKKEQNLMQTLAIRSMAKAIYTTKNIGHYGLAFEHYTHFTSPIRRYPDVLVHRILNEYLSDENKKSKLLDKLMSKSDKRKTNYNMPTLEPMCKHCSDREKLAADAERSSIKYKQVEFMQDKLGNIYKAVISGVTDFGIFAEIEENLCEGFIRLNSIKTDYFEFDQENYCITGRRTKKVFRLGDEIYVKVAKANLVKKQLDFELESSEF
jgi:ribonuclease R